MHAQLVQAEHSQEAHGQRQEGEQEDRPVVDTFEPPVEPVLRDGVDLLGLSQGEGTALLPRRFFPCVAQRL